MPVRLNDIPFDQPFGRLERDMYEDEGTYVVTIVYDLGHCGYCGGGL